MQEFSASDEIESLKVKIEELSEIESDLFSLARFLCLKEIEIIH